VITFAEVSLGAGGDVRCSRCQGAAQPTAYRGAAAVVADIEATAARDLALTGPEPFGHPELHALVSAAVRAGVRRLRLDTDAVALQSPSNAGGVLSAGVRHITFTLLGGTPGVHDALRGGPGSFDAALAGVRTYRRVADEEGVAVSIVAVVPACRHNLHDLPAAVGAAVDAGADSVLVRFEDAGADLAPALPWFTAACDTGVVNGVWVEVEGVPFCLLPGYDLHVSDVVRSRAGAKSPVCATCAADDVCGGGPLGASADILGLLHRPADADRLSRGVSRARGEVRLDG
jgi:hypothetical protein